MTDWLIKVIAAVFIISIVTLILPSGKIGKFVKPLLSIVLIAVIFSPLFDGEFTIGTQSGSSFASDIKYDENYISAIYDKKINYYREGCLNILEDFGISGGVVKIEYIVNEDYSLNIKKVKIYLSDAVIKTENEHIVLMSEIRSEISEYLFLDKKDIDIYE